jgi:endonuclease I
MPPWSSTLSHSRRLTAALAAVAPVWALLAVVVAAPVAQADTGNRDAPHDPATYYAGTEGLSGTALAVQLNSIIDGNLFLPYTSGSTDVWDAMDVLDQDPNDPSKVIDVYSGDSLVLTNKCGSSCPLDGWNREHTWSQSRGSFDTAPGPGTDLFHMRVSRGNTNSSRGNLDFDETVGGSVPGCPTVCTRDSDSFEPRESIKGDVARGLFYMDVRYNGDADDGFGVDLRMWDQTGNSSSQLGKLSTLVAWSLADPPDDRERWRNDTIDSGYQHNRNPFIDHPEWVCSIWGSSNPTACSSTNQPPTITSPTTKSTPRDVPFSLALTATDPNGDPLTWSVVAPAATHGTASITGSAPSFSLSYTPAPGYDGPDSVGVRVSDGMGGIATATIQITVTAVNHPPTVEDLGGDAPIPVPRFNSKQITLLGNDPDGDALTYSVVTPPGRGTVTISGDVATYTATSSSGVDGFTYRATDAFDAQSAPGEVTVSIAASPNPPVTTPISTTTDEDEVKAFALTASDPDGDVLTYAITSQPTKGSVSREGDEVIYTPSPDVTGSDSFTWVATDGTSTVGSTASITINPVNDVPVANAASVSTPEDTAKAVTLTGGDVEGDSLTYAIGSQPAHGSVSLNGALATYTPVADYHGADSFTFTASDASSTSVAKTVSVAVTPVNDAPTATATTSTTAEDTATTFALAGTDPDGDTLTYAVAAQPSHGSVSITAAGEATYTPAAQYSGPDSFTYTLSDGTLVSSVATVSVTVDAVNDAPSVDDVTLHTTAGTPVTATLDTSDPESDTVTILSTTTPTNGTVTFVGADVTYTPATKSGTETFVLTVSDGNGGTDTAQVVVEITARTAVLSVVTPSATRGKPVTTTITASGPAGPKPGGQVTLRSGATTLGTATLGAGGTATVTWTPRSAGLVSLVASYGGNSIYDPAASAPAPLGVAKSPAAFSFSGKVKPGRKGTVKVTIRTLAGLSPTGTVTLKVGTRKFKAALTGGVVTFKIGTVPSKAKLKVRATYAGDAQYAGGAATHVYKL